MREGSLPSTRFSATAFAFGCTKRTPAFAPMSKLCQLRIALSLPWCTVIWFAAWVTLAWPATTWAPVGKAFPAGAAGSAFGAGAAIPANPGGAASAAPESAVPTSAAVSLREALLPRPRAPSATATQQEWTWLQTSR